MGILERSDSGKPLRIRLVGGPESHTFEVFDAETGERITNVERISIDLSQDDPLPIVHLSLFGGLVSETELIAETMIQYIVREDK